VPCVDKVTAEIWKLSPIVERFLGLRSSLPLAQEQIGVMLAVLGSRTEPVRRFIDLGCGDGILAAAVLGQSPSARGVLVDFSEPMLAQARERLGEFEPQLKFENLDYAAPAWVAAVRPEGPFDAIVSGYSIHHQPDARKRSLYAEIFDLLGPGGWFVNVEHVAPAAPLAEELFERYLIEARYAQEVRSGGGRSQEQIAEDIHSRPDREANILAPVEDQCDWLREIGFVSVDCFFKIYELAVFGGKRT
jgi:tRNA (cmo5U34)-methyltransferase